MPALSPSRCNGALVTLTLWHVPYFHYIPFFTSCSHWHHHPEAIARLSSNSPLPHMHMLTELRLSRDLCPNLCEVRDRLCPIELTAIQLLTLFLSTFLPFIATSPHDHRLSCRPPAQDDSKQIHVLPSRSTSLPFKAAHCTV